MFSDSGSLWAKWHKQHHLRNVNFWALEELSTDSWILKSLLQLRPLAERFLRSSVGNGTKTSFWFDTWTPLGLLIKLIGVDGPRSLRLPLKATVAAASTTEGWRIPSPRSESQLLLHAHLTTIQVPSLSHEEDCFDWIVNDVNCRGFSSTMTWEVVRTRKQIKAWSKLVWFKGCVPKHAFNMWVANLNRLPMRVRLVSWGMNIPKECCLCSRLEETRDHLFITCEYNSVIWRIIFSRLSPSQLRLRSWSELLIWTSCNFTEGPSLLRLIVTQAVVFHL